MSLTTASVVSTIAATEAAFKTAAHTVTLRIVNNRISANSMECKIETQALRSVDEWLENYRKLWEQRFDRLDDYLRELQAQGHGKEKTKETKRGRKK